MRNATLICATLCCLSLAACKGKTENQNTDADAAVKASGVPSAEAVSAAQAAGNTDTGGLLTAEISGGKSGHTDIRDIGFCVMKSYGMEIFALSGNNSEWSVSISSSKGLPSVGALPIIADDPTAINVSVADKSTGSEPAQWQQYNATSGAVTFTKVTPTMVEGTYTLEAAPTSPKKTGPNVEVTGKFSAPPAAACS